MKGIKIGLLMLLMGGLVYPASMLRSSVKFIKNNKLVVAAGVVGAGVYCWLSQAKKQPPYQLIFEHSSIANDLQVIATLSREELEIPDENGNALLVRCVFFDKPEKVLEAIINRGARQDSLLSHVVADSRGTRLPELIRSGVDLRTNTTLPLPFMGGIRETKLASEWLLAKDESADSTYYLRLQRLQLGLKGREKRLKDLQNPQLIAALTTALPTITVKDLIALIADYQSHLSEADEALLIKAQQKIKEQQSTAASGSLDEAASDNKDEKE